jgi:hypothetical protein
MLVVKIIYGERKRDFTKFLKENSWKSGLEIDVLHAETNAAQGSAQK